MGRGYEENLNIIFGTGVVWTVSVGYILKGVGWNCLV